MYRSLVVLSMMLACVREPDREEKTVATEMELARISERSWRVTSTADGVVYVLAQHRPTDARYRGETQIRLLEMRWQGVRLLACGQCDGLTAHAGEGDASYVWAGGGHGMESSPRAVTWLVDGVEVALAVGQAVAGETVEVRQATDLYGPSSVLVGLEQVIRIDSSKYEWAAAWTALRPTLVQLDYDVMLSGVAVCDGGIWDRVELNGINVPELQIDVCPTTYAIINAAAGVEAALVSSSGRRRSAAPAR